MLKFQQAAIAVAMIFAMFATCAKASIIDFQFEASLESGTLAGTQFSGTASYDNAGSTGIGTEYLSLVSLNFSLLGSSFTLADIGQGGQAILQNGDLSYFTAAFFPQTGPFDDLAFGFGGPGIIGYSTPPGFNFGAGVYEIGPVPEPPSLLLCGVGLLIALCVFCPQPQYRRRRWQLRLSIDSLAD
jgi:hypothetical protein